MNTMNLALIGYGKLGGVVKNIADSKGIFISAIIDPTAEGATAKDITEESLKGADVCIDFTLPEVVVGNVEKVAKLGKNMVVGTTGWHDDLEKVRKIVEDSGIGFLYASNFSLGMNIFFRMVKNSAAYFNKFPDYDSFGYELHHNRKKDSPSGTAKSLAEIMVKGIDGKKKIVYDKLDRKIGEDELHFASVRAGDIPGTHVIGFDSVADTVELKHTARNREGFALGSLKAAEWINGKKGFYTIDDMMNEILGE
ncbi:MAG: 4-hydroxy-tetrahydrodipicolinate reductase [Candidatus Diapherotrites archaeon]